MASRSTPIAAGRLAIEQGANQTGACTAILEEQLSRVACIAGVNFGCRDGVVWAQRCRGRFSCKEVGVSFLCGWPITGEERRCRCDGQETWSATACLANVGATVRTRSPPPQGVLLKSTRIASGSDCSTAARIAIGFFGAMRSITLVARSIRTNLLAPLRKAGGVDVFAYGLTGSDIYESSGPLRPLLRNAQNRSVFSLLIRDSNDAACQGLQSPDAACGRATLQRYLRPCRAQVELQADIDRRYRFEERARCDVKARAQNSGYNTRQLLNIYRERYSLREVCMECAWHEASSIQSPPRSAPLGRYPGRSRPVQARSHPLPPARAGSRTLSRRAPQQYCATCSATQYRATVHSSA